MRDVHQRLGFAPPEPWRSRARRGGRRALPFVVVAAIVCLVTVAVFTVPVTAVSRTGTVWSHIVSSDQANSTQGWVFDPPQSQCPPAGEGCTNIWFAFNWSTLHGQVMTMQFLEFNGAVPPASPITYLYSSSNLSYGGYVCHPMTEPCYFQEVATNDSSDTPWYLQLAVFYDYTATPPLF